MTEVTHDYLSTACFHGLHGIQRRPSKLRAYGNAIVPQVAAEFIAAYAECEP